MRHAAAIVSIVSLAPLSCGALAGSVAFSNFANFVGDAGSGGQTSAVTAANAAIVQPFVSNTASMQVVLGEAASVRTVHVLAPLAYVADASSMPGRIGLGADPMGDVDPRDTPSPAADGSSLAPLRVSIYASAADVASRNAFAAVDFSAGAYGSSIWGANPAFYDLSFDLGATFDLGAGDWFIEVAQVDPGAAQFFLAIREGAGMHRFDPFTMQFGASGYEFALELGSGVVIPLPTGGALAMMGLSAIAARRRRAC